MNSALHLDWFTAKFGVRPREDSSLRKIDWRKVAERYGGIIIAPYVYSRRLSPHTHWYYGWDCASGCIWDASVVKQLEVSQDHDYAALAEVAEGELQKYEDRTAGIRFR